MKKFLISVAALAALSSAAFADKPIFNDDKVADCLSPDGSISDCYDDALNMGAVDYWRKHSAIMQDPIAQQKYLTIVTTGCDRGVAISDSGAKLSESDRKKTGKMCMERGNFYLDDYRLRQAGWENSLALIQESMKYLEKAKIHPDTSHEFGIQTKTIERLKIEANWQIEAKKLQDECDIQNIAKSCVQWGSMRLQKYPNASSYGDRIEARYFEKGIEGGEPTAYFALAGLYLLDKKPNEAVNLMGKGCTAGHALACKTAANSLFIGENGANIDVNRAGKLYAEACRLDPTDLDSCANAPKKKVEVPTPSPAKKPTAKKSKK